MDSARWIADWPGRAHAYLPGSTVSLCGQVALPLVFHEDEKTARCGNCQRIVVQRLAAQKSVETPDAERWREVAVRAVLGELWTVEEAERMPSFMEEIGRVQVALAEAFKEGILQGNASSRSPHSG